MHIPFARSLLKPAGARSAPEPLVVVQRAVLGSQSSGLLFDFSTLLWLRGALGSRARAARAGGRGGRGERTTGDSLPVRFFTQKLCLLCRILLDASALNVDGEP